MARLQVGSFGACNSRHWANGLCVIMDCGVVIVDIKKTIKHNLITLYSTLVKLSNEVSDCSLCYIKMYGNISDFSSSLKLANCKRSLEV